MAKASSKAADQDDSVAPRARLHKLTISNFRAIGAKPVTIELDDIVVLVGPNNAGKSSILRAYEVVMESGKLNELTIEDFPSARLPEEGKADVLPTIELETVLYEDSKPPAKQWIDVKANGDRHVRERWVWRTPGKPEKRGYNVEAGGWDSDHGPWGVAGVAQINRPEPHRIEAFANPQEQAEEIVSLLQEAIKEKLKDVSKKSEAESGEKSQYGQLLESVADLQKRVAVDALEAIRDVNNDLSKSISDVFPDFSITLDARPEDDLERVVSFFRSSPILRMGPVGGHQSTLERQGSGARRTLLWTALRILAEHARTKKGKGEVSERPHVLLIDEPEMCLHPTAIRDACRVLYSLPQSKKWQVMVTTHSPIFIDLSRDNTSIVRVQREASGEISGTTIYRPERAKLNSGEKDELKLLNMYDPYVAEFFFGGKTIIVEGDTEHSVFKEIAFSDERFRDVHVVRARGKFTIVALCKILNQFGAPYSVLHDADFLTIKTKKGDRANPAWAANQQILDAVAESPSGDVRLVASIPNFEVGLFGEAADGEKPYAAWEKVRKDADVKKRVTALLAYLARIDDAVPAGVSPWSDIKKLELEVRALGS
ncbi:ATP-dependent nuclease [Burkholderia ubonensis]|uniref:ATP-dependent nuclease n=1 Tax=Burkholderia ubonensis TaxID=101571 RepID=UPI00031B2FDE|nr:AAA family ATPase [Burkholderia ubonensis]